MLSTQSTTSAKKPVQEIQPAALPSQILCSEQISGRNTHVLEFYVQVVLAVGEKNNAEHFSYKIYVYRFLL